MRLALQIFRKDTERLWRAILLSFVFVAAFAVDGAFGWMSRVENAANPAAGLVNIALPLLWGFLIALAIQEDPLTGDRQFWVALPCGWPPLILAKIMFVAAFVQIPYFVATAIILAVHGFNPVTHIPHLLWKQLVLLTLIFPTAALATAVKNIAQFFLTAIAVLAYLILMGRSINIGLLQVAAWDVRWVLALSILAAGGLVVTALQFMRRVTIRSRIVGIVTLLGAAGIYSWLSPEASADIRAAFSSAPPAGQGPISVQVSSTDSDRSHQHFFQWGVTTVAIPIAFTGLSPDMEAHFNQVALDLIDARSDRLEAKRQALNSPTPQLLAMLESGGPGVPQWLILKLRDFSDWNRFRNGPVTIQGRVFADFYRSARPVLLPANGARTIPGVGNCASGSIPLFGVATQFVVECESPDLAAGTVRVESRPNDEQRREAPSLAKYPIHNRLREDGFQPLPIYPRSFWLSPLHRGATVLLSGSPRSSTDVAIIREIPLGSVVFSYTIPNVDLNQYMVNEPELRR